MKLFLERNRNSYTSSPARRWLLVASLLVVAFQACSGERSFTPDSSGANTSSGGTSDVGFSSSTIRTLRSFGAIGDTVSDDTQSIRKALNSAATVCLDGEGMKYKVVGTLQVSTNLCLRNATLVQSISPFDSGPYILSANSSYPVLSASETDDDPRDPTLPSSAQSRINDVISVRTLLIRPPVGASKIAVTLSNVNVVMGTDPRVGSRTDSAGVWLENADSVLLSSVDCSGKGHGTCLFFNQVSNLWLEDVTIHDLIWAPYDGDVALNESRVNATGWNSFPIFEYSATLAKFVRLRAQEQLVGLSILNSHDVHLSRVNVAGIRAKFDTGLLQVQTDGIDINSSYNVAVDGCAVSKTWEGIDVIGNGSGVAGVSILNSSISDSWNFGLKFGYQTSGVQISNTSISGSGIAGIVINAPATNIAVNQTKISETGVVAVDAASRAPWVSISNRAGLQINSATGISLKGVSSLNIANPRAYEFGFWSSGAGNSETDLSASGYSISARNGI